MFQSQDTLPSSFGELAECLFAQLPYMASVDYVTDLCFQNSIKSIERNRRGTSAIHLKAQQPRPPEAGKHSCPMMKTKAGSSDSFKINGRKTGLQPGFKGENCTLSVEKSA